MSGRKTVDPVIPNVIVIGKAVGLSDALHPRKHSHLCIDPRQFLCLEVLYADYPVFRITLQISSYMVSKTVNSHNRACQTFINTRVYP